jgi:hypothetical protein
MAMRSDSVIQGSIPAVLLVLFAGFCGTFDRGASFAAALVAVGVLLGVAGWTSWGGLDPLRLGRLGRFVPIGLCAALVAGVATSPLPRAGRVAIVLLPAFLCVPSATAKALSGPAARRIGLRALRLALGGVAAFGLVHWLATDVPRAAMPLGHHNLYAGVLVALLPAAVLGLRGGEGTFDRLLSLVVTGLALAGVAASGSLLAAVAVGVQVFLALLWRVQLQKLLLPSALLILALQMPRVAAIVRGTDVSTQARLAYLEAGWRGLQERPWLGWGAGTTPWTIAEFMRPIPGVHPPGEIIGDLHSLPLQILYELGGVGFAFTLGTAAMFLRKRVRDRPAAGDPGLLAAGLIGLLGAAVTRLGGASLSILAMPLTVALSAGLALAGAAPPGATEATGRASIPRPRWAGLATALGLALGAALLFAPLRATALYDQARGAATAQEGRELLARAHQSDPQFPLYALVAGRLDSAAGLPGAGNLARTGAAGGPGIAAGWLIAGDALSRDGDLPAARAAWARAATLDPLGGGAAALRLSWHDEGVAAREGWLVRALEAEPRFLAAEPAEAIADVLPAAIARIERDATLDEGWRARFVEVAREASATPRSTERGTFESTVDATPRDALSLHAFRRAPWPAALVPVTLDRARAEVVERSGLPAGRATAARPERR